MTDVSTPACSSRIAAVCRSTCGVIFLAASVLERQNILADIRRGTWVPFSVQRKRAKQKQVVTAVTVREAATMFYNDIKGGLTPRGREGMLWRMGHLLEFFAKPDDPEGDPRNERVDWALQDVDHAA